MQRNVPKQMALSEFEALQRATIQHAASFGIDRPAAMDFDRLSQDDFAALHQGRTTIAQFQRPQTFSANMARDMRVGQVEWVKRALGFMLGGK